MDVRGKGIGRRGPRKGDQGKAWHVLEQRGQSAWSRVSEEMRGGGPSGLQELLKLTYPRRDGPHERVLSVRVK